MKRKPWEQYDTWRVVCNETHMGDKKPTDTQTVADRQRNRESHRGDRRSSIEVKRFLTKAKLRLGMLPETETTHAFNTQLMPQRHTLRRGELVQTD